jgi:hypothetical protein
MTSCNENWVRVDEAEDVAASVRHALRCYQLVSDDSQVWKWIVLSLHSALQGACVCHLVTTATPVGAVTEHNAKAWISYLESSRANTKQGPPKTFLMSLPDLVKAARKPHSAGDGSNSNGIVITDGELAWLNRVHDTVRNQFVHFEPMGWSLEVSGIPDFGRLVARMIDEILEIGWAFRHKDAAWKTALNTDLKLLAEVRV